MPSAIKPIIFLVPGLWEGSMVYAQVRTLLESAGYKTQAAALASTGKLSPGNPSMEDDITSLHAAIAAVIQEDQEVLLVLHSAGGFIGSEAMQGLDVKHRKEAGLKGGVVGIVFLAAGIGRVGYTHVNLPFMDFENAPKGGMLCVNPRELLFNDLSDAEAEKWMKEMKPQPAEGWNGVTQYCGWQDVPSTFLICEKDLVLPVSIQELGAQLAGSKVERCQSGHMVMLSMPERVVEVIKGTAERLIGHGIDS